jgi:hypothetical protein
MRGSISLRASSHFPANENSKLVRAARDRDHHRHRLVFASAAIIALTVEASTGPVIRIRARSQTPPRSLPADLAAEELGPLQSTAQSQPRKNTGSAGAGPQSSCRHRNNWLAFPASRATSDQLRQAQSQPQQSAPSPLSRPAPATLYRRDHLNLRLRHRTSPRISPMTLSPGAYRRALCPSSTPFPRRGVCH